MADQENNLSAEDSAIVGNLLEPLDQPDIERVFNPHLEQFTRDMEELQLAPGDAETEFPDFAEVPSDFPPEEDTSAFFGQETSPGGDLPEAEPFGDLGALDEIPAEAPDAGDDLMADFSTEAPPAGADDFDLGDFAPDDSESGAPGQTAPATVPDSPPDDGFDLGDLELNTDQAPTVGPDSDDFGLGDLDVDSSQDSDTPDIAAGDGVGDFDLSEEPPATDDFGLGDLDLGTPDAGTTEAGVGDLDFGDLDLESPAPTASAATDGLDLGGLDLGESIGPSDSEEPADDFLLPDAGPTEAPAAAAAAGDFDLSPDMADGLDLGPGSPAGGMDMDSGDLDFSDLDATPDGGLDFDEPTGAGVVAAEPLASRDDFATDDLAGDLGADLLDSGDLSDMAEQAKMQSGIGDEFTDQDLANLRTNLNDFPSGIKKSVIDVIVNEKIERTDQRLLVNLVIGQASPEQIADFIEERLGYRPDTSAPDVTKDGVPIIYAEGMSPEDVARRRRNARLVAIAAAAGFVALLGGFGLYYFLGQRSIQGLYEQGLEELTAARGALGDERVARKTRAEEYFQKALNKSGGHYETAYLNRYGIAYMKAGFHEEAFRKLFGEVSPAFGIGPTGQPDPATAWNRPGRRVPLIRPVDGSKPFPPAVAAEGGRGFIPEGRGALLVDQDNRTRRVEVAGAFILDRLRDRELDRRTLINLARFHSQTSGGFLDSPEGDKFKNDGLGIDYYRLILTLMNRPNDTEAIAGIGRIHYQRGEYGEAAREYSKVIDKEPLEVSGHAGLLNTYIEIWASKDKKDPRWVIAKHREIQKLGLESKLPIYIMSKLAGFYIDLNADDLRIVYQINPKDPVSGLEIRDNAIRLLEMIFRAEEVRDEEKVVGSRYGEGFYQRGRFLLSQGEATRALQQFQNAHQYDPRHFLAVNDMGEYYKKQLDFAKARQYFEEARAIHERYHKTYGGRPEDETLMKGDLGKIYYNLGSLVFLRNAGVPDAGSGGFPESRLYPARASEWTPEQRNRIRLLNEASGDFLKALELLKDERAKLESIYWLGWIEYTNGNFDRALERWSELDTLYEENYNDPVLLMARGNAYYYTEQLRAALGNFRKVLDDYEQLANDVSRPNPADSSHSRLYLTLSAVNNNIGAVYEREYMETLAENGEPSTMAELEKIALRHYFLSIDHARKIDYDNEIARTNQKLAFKYLESDRRNAGGQEKRIPLIDDWVSPVLPSLRRPDTAERRRQ